MRAVKRELVHPVTGQRYQAWLRSKGDWDKFNQTRAAWDQIRLQRQSGGQDATAVQQPVAAQQMTPQGLRQGVISADRAVPRQNIPDSEMLRLLAPSLLSMGVSALPGGPVLRTAGYGLAGLVGGQIAGTDPRQEALSQMAWGAPGEMLSGLSKAVGLGAMRKGFNAAPELKESFGDIGGAAAREGIGISNPRTLAQGPEKAGIGEKLLGNKTPFTGSEAAAYKLDKVKNEIGVVLARDKTQYNLDDLYKEVRRRLKDKFSNRLLRGDVYDNVDDVLARIKADPRNPSGTIDNLGLWEFKKGAQDAAVELLNRGSRPTVSTAEAEAKATAEQLVNKEAQQVANEWLDKVPGYRAKGIKYRELYGIKQAAAAAEVGKDATASARAVTGATAPRVAFNPEGALSPQMMTGFGRGATLPATLFAERNLPRAILEAIRYSQGDPTIDPVPPFMGGQR